MLYRFAVIYLLWKAQAPTWIPAALAILCILKMFMNIWERKAKQITARLVAFTVLQEYEEFNKELVSVTNMLERKGPFSYFYIASIQSLVGRDTMQMLKEKYNKDSGGE